MSAAAKPTIKRQRRGTSGRTRMLFVGALSVPTANQFAPIIDTTPRPTLPDENMHPMVAVAAVPDPAQFNGGALGRLYGISLSCTGQNVTFLQYHLHGDGTWQQFASTTIVAGAAAQAFTWDPSAFGAIDVYAACQAGANAPSTIYCSITERDLP